MYAIYAYFICAMRVLYVNLFLYVGMGASVYVRYMYQFLSVFACTLCVPIFICTLMYLFLLIP